MFHISRVFLLWVGRGGADKGEVGQAILLGGEGVYKGGYYSWLHISLDYDYQI